jgi:hypothetical protein
LEFLEVKSLVVKARPLSTRGRPTTLYALRDYTPDDIIKAADNDRLLRTSGYAESKRITQLLLDDYFEVITKSYRGMTVVVKSKVVEIIKKESGGYDYEFLWKLICPEFTRKGYAIEI